MSSYGNATKTAYGYFCRNRKFTNSRQPRKQNKKWELPRNIRRPILAVICRIINKWKVNFTPYNVRKCLWVKSKIVSQVTNSIYTFYACVFLSLWPGDWCVSILFCFFVIGLCTFWVECKVALLWSCIILYFNVFIHTG